MKYWASRYGTSEDNRTPTTPRTQLSGIAGVGIVGQCLHFARGVGRNQRALAIRAMIVSWNISSPPRLLHSPYQVWASWTGMYRMGKEE